MSDTLQSITPLNIHSRIFTIRGQQVMLDSDLAELYQVETRVLNQAVKRNMDRFPAEFMFQMTKEELDNWKSQIVISNKELMGLRKAPNVFTEAGVSMLAAVLKSETAIKMSVDIIRAFVGMRRWIADNAAIFHRLDAVEQRQRIADTRLNSVFEAIEAKEIKPAQGIFFDGQVFDAYAFAADLIKSAKQSIVLIDNYVDETTLLLLSKRKKACAATIYTRAISQKLQLDLKKHNTQYSPINIHKFADSHDRFLILDDETVYHLGATPLSRPLGENTNLPPLPLGEGRGEGAFSRFEKAALTLLGR